MSFCLRSGLAGALCWWLKQKVESALKKVERGSAARVAAQSWWRKKGGSGAEKGGVWLSSFCSFPAPRLKKVERGKAGREKRWSGAQSSGAQLRSSLRPAALARPRSQLPLLLRLERLLSRAKPGEPKKLRRARALRFAASSRPAQARSCLAPSGCQAAAKRDPPLEQAAPALCHCSELAPGGLKKAAVAFEPPQQVQPRASAALARAGRAARARAESAKSQAPAAKQL